MKHEDAPAKELLYCWATKGFNVLVPKKRGSGYVKVPYGHHPNRDLDKISIAARCDIFGLDGCLYFECSGSIYYGGDEERAKFVGRIVPMLEAYYGWPAREIAESDFWKLHPCPGHTGFENLMQ